MKPFAAITLIGICASAYVVAGQSGSPVLGMVGKSLPAIKMTTSKGKTITNANLKGKVVILDFWATWCPPCRAASPTMQALHTKYGKKGLVVIGANSGENRNADGAAAGYAKEHGYTYTFTKKNDAFSQKIGVQGLPTFIVVDKKGRIRDVSEGWGDTSAQKFDAMVRRLLAEK